MCTGRAPARLRAAGAFVVLGLLLTTSCASSVPFPSATREPSAAPSPTSTPVTFEITAELWMDNEAYPLRGGSLADADVPHTFRLNFQSTVMDPDSVAAAIRRSGPEATNFRWENGERSVLFEVPAGTTTVTINAAGARSASGAGMVAQGTWVIRRPSTAVSLFDPAALARGDQKPARSYTFPVTPGDVVRFDPAEETALLWHGSSADRAMSFVDVATGRRTPLAPALVKIASNGAQQRWLPDGRFLTIGTHDTVVAGPLGESPRWLQALKGQGGVVSPSGTKLAIWSYAEATAAIVDLDSGSVLSLGAEYLRCSADGGAFMAWSPDGRTLAISHCAEDMKGAPRTVYIDAASGRAIFATEGSSLAAWFPDGRKILLGWPPSEDPRRTPDPELRLVDAVGRLLNIVSSSSVLGVSPDGHWLLERTGPDHSLVQLRRLSDGLAYSIPIAGAHPSWTPSGLIAVVHEAP